jgi:hypothetical protein
MVEKYEEMTDRELAVELDISEEDVKERRRSSGFLRLDEFNDSDDGSRDLNINAKLNEMEKRKVQGFLGEKVASLMRSRVINHLEDHLNSSWILREKMHLVNENSSHERYWASGRPRQGSMRIQGRQLKNHGAEEDEIKDYIREKCVLATEDIFRKFREVRNPFIDFNFYAVRKAGSKKTSFSVQDYSSNTFESGDRIDVEVPIVSDFKIVMLEVKTSKNSAKNLFSKNQRKARDMAKESPFLDFFSLKIDEEFSEMDIPTEFKLEIEKHS